MLRANMLTMGYVCCGQCFTGKGLDNFILMPSLLGLEGYVYFFTFFAFLVLFLLSG